MTLFLILIVGVCIGVIANIAITDAAGYTPSESTRQAQRDAVKAMKEANK